MIPARRPAFRVHSRRQSAARQGVAWLRLSVVVLLLGLMSAVSAYGQVGWTSDAPVVATGPIEKPALAVNPAGAIAVVTVRCQTAGDCSFTLARSSRDSTWTFTSFGLIGDYAAPDAAMDPAGNLVFVWQAPSGIQAAYAAVAPPGVPPPPVAPVTISGPGAIDPEVAIDPDGNAMAVWVTPDEAVEAARYNASTATWSAPELLQDSSGVRRALVTLDAAGNGFAVWSRAAAGGKYVVVGRRYVAAQGVWGPAAVLSPDLDDVGTIVLDVDGAGNAVMAWDQEYSGALEVIATRHTAATGSWGPPVRLSSTGVNAGVPSLDLDDAGNVTAVWMRADGIIEGSRYTASSGIWLLPVPLTGPYVVALLPSVVVDAHGNATFTWIELRDSGSAVHSARFTADNQFGTLVDLTTSDIDHLPELGVDAVGNVIVLLPLTPYNPTGTSLVARRWSARPGAPTLVEAVPADGSLAVAFQPPVTAEALLTPITYEFSLDDGLTWTPRSPAGVTSPLVIPGLTNHTTYSVRLRAVNSAGPGLPSGPMVGTPAPGPDPPTGLLVADVSGNVVTLAWTPAAAGTPPTGYVLEGGSSPGEVLASIPTGSASPGFTFTAPSGAFYIRVHAVSGALRSAPSNEVPLLVRFPATPSTPASLLEAAHGDMLLLSWTPTFGGGAPTSYVLSVTGTLSVTLTLPVSERFSFDGVPPGTYTFALAARNAFGTSPESNAITVEFPASCIDGPLPGTPTYFRVAQVGSTLTAQWEPPATGRAISHYRLAVNGVVTGGGPWVFDLETPSRTLSGAVPSGTYTSSVAGVNACFTGGSSPPVTVTVP